MTTAEALSDPATRAAVVAELNRGASLAVRAGNQAWKAGRCHAAVAEYQAFSQRLRAAEALAKGAEFDPRDLCHVEEALAAAQARMSGSYAAAGGAR